MHHISLDHWIKKDITIFDNLTRPLHLDELSPALWSDKCDYVDVIKCNNLNPENYNLMVMQHNIRGLLGNITKLKQLLDLMTKKNSTIDILLLCETFLNKKTISLVNLPGY